jgi:hypothetical protein
MSSLCVWLGILSLLVAIRPPLSAQVAGPDSLAGAPSVESHLRRLRPGTPVRLSSGPGSSFIGSFVRMVPAGVMLSNPTTGVESLVAQPIDTLWIRGASTGRGAKVGALLGGVVVGAAIYAFAEGDCTLGCAAPFMAGGGLIGAGVGALAGAVVGGQVRVWRRVYP